ncbi:MAG: DUF3566 domain-containing protein [Nocardioidaceae bacterium]
MTNPGENDSVAPHRPLGKSATSAQQPTQKVAASSGGSRGGAMHTETAQSGAVQSVRSPGRPPAEYPSADETGKTLPVRESPPGAAADTAAAQAAREKASRKGAGRRPTRTRRARLRMTRIDPWSVTKTAFLLSIAVGIMCCVAVFLVFSIMNAAGLWDHINTTIQGVVNQQPGHQFDIKQYVGMSRVMGVAILISAVDVVLITALATLGAFIYNLSAAVLGGVEVTLAEDLK